MRPSPLTVPVLLLALAGLACAGGKGKDGQENGGENGGVDSGDNGGDNGGNGGDNGGNGGDNGGDPPCDTTGFVASPDSWPLPDGFTEFYDTGTSSAYCDSGRNVPEFSTFDLTGDGLPDLVVTDICDDTRTGQDRWLVYRNNGAGFEASPDSWPLPEGYSEFYDTGTSSAYCDSGRNVPEFRTFDLTGDGLPDMVVTDICDDTRTGQERWLVYRNNGSGFEASPDSWALPEGYSEFYDTGTSSAYCDSGRNVPEFGTFDLTGDGLPDMVVTDICDDTRTGQERWLVYRNNGSGFEASPDSWALPEGYSEFYDTGTSSAYCDSGRNVPEFRTFDLTGDGLPDMVVTDICDDTRTGQERWLVYRNNGAGFEASPDSWSLPKGYSEFYDTGTSSAYCDSGRNVPEFSTFDLNRDHLPDIVVTDICDDETTGSTRWLFYRNEGAGFAASPDTWALPEGYSELYDTGTSSAYCDSGRNVPEFSTFDLDGGAAPDIVITDICDDSTTGKTRWLLYPNSCG